MRSTTYDVNKIRHTVRNAAGTFETKFLWLGAGLGLGLAGLRLG